jgi:hypothetical protein
MAYLANTWYVQYENGSIEPVANLATARYLVASKIAIRIINTNQEVLATL